MTTMETQDPEINTDSTSQNSTHASKAFWSAMSRAQLEMRSPEKKGYNPHFKSSYIRLEEILHGPVKTMNKHGLSVSQWPTYMEGAALVTTVISHSSGERIQHDLRLPCEGNVQKIGSAISYARRYALQSILGIAGEDDDGNAASQPKKPTKRTVKKAAIQKPKDDEFGDLA